MSNQSASGEKRRFRRILFDAPVTMTLDRNTHTSQLIDISLKGALIRRPADWPEITGKSVNLCVLLDNESASIKMEAIIKHGEEDRLGFQCLHIDMDSIAHLRRLVELNLGDEELLGRELEELL